MPDTPTVRVGGMTIDRVTEREAIATIVAGGGGWVITPNVDILRQVSCDRGLARLVEDATLVLADGMPVVWAGWILGAPFPERVAGSTLIYGLCAEAARCRRSVFLLGGAPGVGDRAADVLRSANPELEIVGVYCPPYGFEQSSIERLALESAVVASAPDIVFVALGSPKQEQLIARVRSLLPNAWFIGSGATLSFVAGETPRAPTWLQSSGLEWLFRLVHEPRRLFRRYVVLDIPFAVRLLAACIGIRAVRIGHGVLQALGPRPGVGARTERDGT